MTCVSRIKMAPEGPEFSQLVQGYWRMADWNMDPQARLTFLKQHLELGISTVDHAHVYGSAQQSCESLFGEALKLDPGMRDQIEIISKCGIELMPDNAPDGYVNHYNTSRETILASVDTSLSRLGVEQLDVLLIHRSDLRITVRHPCRSLVGERHRCGQVSCHWLIAVSYFSMSLVSLPHRPSMASANRSRNVRCA